MERNLIDMDLLEKLQMQFSGANSMYLACLDKERKVISACYRTGAEERFFEERIPSQTIQRLLDTAYASQIESIIEETLEVPYLKLCAVINKALGEPVLVWVAAAVIEDALTEEDVIPEYVLRISEGQFYRALGFLENLTSQLLSVEEQKLQGLALMERAEDTQLRFNEQMRRSEAMTEIVHMLESEEQLLLLEEKMLQIVCKTLNIEGGCILYLPKEEKAIQVAAEYSREENDVFGKRVAGKTKIKLPFFNGRPYVLSSKSAMPAEMEKFLTRYHLKAAIFQPIAAKNRSQVYLCFYQFQKRHLWSMEEIAFINDAKRVLQILLERRIAQEQLIGQKMAYHSILEHVGCGIYVIDDEKKEILYVNEQFQKMLEASLGQQDMKTYFFGDKHLEKTFVSKEVYMEKTDTWLNISQITLSWIDGRTVLLGTVYDITDKKLYQQKIEKQISLDNLTGLYNRIRCEQDLESYIKEAELTGKEGAYICIDLDDFKNINAALGHRQADELLKLAAHNLLRISGIENNCYRINGDEFAVIVYGKEYRSLSRICKDLRAVFERPWFIKDEEYYCTMSMGVVCFPTDGNTIDDLNRKVNIALSTAKKKGRNSVELYNKKVEAVSMHRVDLEKNMRRATLNSCNEFEVYYQPIMALQGETLSCCGAEALVRWNSSELGTIMPNDFIPLAEALGVIQPIGEHVLSEAAARCKYWNENGFPDYKIHVNISVIQLLQPDFPARVKQIFDKIGIQTANVVLEVTEKLAVTDMERMKEVLLRLKKQGIQIALDDFGTGYSSFNHIRELPIDMIKIDSCIVKNLGEDEFTEVFIKMTTELAKAMHLSVCVEGVEQLRQMQRIKELSVEFAQGFYYGKPMTEKEFEKIFIKNKNF